MFRTRSSRIWFAALLALVILLPLLSFWKWRETQEGRFDQEIVYAAGRYGVDPALVKAVIWQESKFQPDVRGKAGEIGLMQIREDAAWEWAGEEEIYPFDHEIIADPGKNILAGTFYLSKVMKRYLKTDNPIPYALADYNAGRTHVLRWKKGAAETNSAAFLEQMDFPGTREYALNVMERYEYYREEFNR